MQEKPSKKSSWMRNNNLTALAFAVLSLTATWLLLTGAQQKAYFPLALYGLLLFLLFKVAAGIQNIILSPRLEYILSFFFSVTSVLGSFFDRGISFENVSGMDLLKGLLCSVVLAEPVRKLLRLLCEGLLRWAGKEKTRNAESAVSLQNEPGSWLFGKPALCFLISFLVILVCWLPVWLAYYPGLWNYDPWQVEQVMTGVYSKHHPLLHTLLLGNCYRFALARNYPNLAPILYSAIQGGICASIFALACTMIHRRTDGQAFFIISLLFFSLFPVHPILAMSTTKDTLFSAMVLLAGLLFVLIIESSGPRKWILMAAEILVLVLVILFRNNAIYCLLALILLCLPMGRKKPWRRILAVLMAGSFLGFVADRALGRSLRASPSLIAEMCSVPSQMAGRVQARVDNLDPETEAFLADIYSLDKLSYNPALADETKRCLRFESPGDVLRCAEGTLRMFWKYPAICIDSFLYTTEGLWNIHDVSHTQIYGTGNRQGYLATDIQSGYSIQKDSKLPFLEHLLEKVLTENAFLHVPFLRFLFAPAFYVDLLLLAFLIMLRGKLRRRIVLPLFLLLLILTIALGPCVLPRYIYPLMVCSPLLIWMALKSVASTANTHMIQLSNSSDHEKPLTT